MPATLSPATLSPRSAARRLTMLYIVALGAVATLSIVGQCLVQLQIQRQTSDSHLINLAGRQRMLSQRLAKAALAIQATDDPELQRAYLRELKSVVDLWKASHAGLKDGNAELNLPGRNSASAASMLAALDEHYAPLVSGATELLDSPEPLKPAAAVARILAHEGLFLAAMDEVVSQYEREAESRLAALRRSELILLAITLVVLAAEAWLVFRPAVRSVRQAIAALEDARESLARAKAAAEAANQAKTQFLVHMSHELRTPMNAVLGLTDLVLDDSGLDARPRKFLTAARESAQGLLRLLNEALDLAKVESGRLELEHRPFDVRGWVQGVVDTFVPQAEAKGLACTCRIAASVPECVVGDAHRLRQIIANLLSNAVKFTDRGEIEISVTAEPVRERRVGITFSVRDTGLGIPADKQQHIFEAFAQADASTTRRFGGTGLGLAVSAQLASLMHGRLSVTSTPGVGSVFCLTAEFESVNEEAFPLAVPRDVEAPSVRPRRVLVAEDTEASQLFARATLESRGHHVVVASNGAEAIEALANEPFDVVLMDLRMPEVDGLAAVAAIRGAEQAGQSAPRVPVLALSASVTRGDRERCLAAGMDDLLAKPIDPRELLRAVETWTESWPGETASGRPEACDFDASLARLEGNKSLWKSLAELVLRDGTQLMVAIGEALEARDSQALEVAAHRLGGLVQNVAADELAAAAARFEAAGRDATWPDLTAARQELDRAWEQLCAELTARLAART